MQQRNATIVGFRDPDGGTDLRLFIDGAEVGAREIITDPGRGGYIRSELEQLAEERAGEAASPEEAEAIREVYQQALDSKFTEEG